MCCGIFIYFCVKCFYFLKVYILSSLCCCLFTVFLYALLRAWTGVPIHTELVSVDLRREGIFVLLSVDIVCYARR